MHVEGGHKPLQGSAVRPCLAQDQLPNKLRTRLSDV